MEFYSVITNFSVLLAQQLTSLINKTVPGAGVGDLCLQQVITAVVLLCVQLLIRIVILHVLTL